jgi:AcrR family transcriptional regulator
MNDTAQTPVQTPVQTPAKTSAAAGVPAGERPAQHLPLEEMQPTRKVGRFHHGDLRLSLLTAAARALATRGDADISLRELARELGVTHAAAYRHFAAKSDLLAALATRGWVRLAEVVVAVIADSAADDAAERLRRVGRAYLAFAAANPGPYQAMHLKELRHGRDFPDLDVAVDHLALIVANLINEAQAAGALRGDIAAQDLAGAMLAGLDGAARAVLLNPAAEAVADHLVDLIAAGAAATPPARKPAPQPAAAAQPAPAEKRERRRSDAESMTLDLFG